MVSLNRGAAAVSLCVVIGCGGDTGTSSEPGPGSSSSSGAVTTTSQPTSTTEDSSGESTAPPTGGGGGGSDSQTTDATTSSTTTTGDSSSSGAPDPFCGDGIVDPGEECDDGNVEYMVRISHCCSNLIFYVS